jgi:predicted dehydrogenase
MEQVRWGIIGCGNVTEVKSGPAFGKCQGSELVAVMRRSREKAQDYARRHKAPKWYNDAEALIHDPDVNAVYVATPPAWHAEYTLKAVRAGKPVYVEKPMARNHGECRQMIEACQTGGVPLFVAYYRRGLPAFLKVKELVNSGAIGEVRFATIALYQPPCRDDQAPDNLPWRVLPEISGAGYFFDLGSHQLDVLDYLLGPIAAARGQTANQAGHYPAEDIVTAEFTFESGILGSGLWCFTASEPSRLERTELIGTKGKIAYSCFDLDAPVLLKTGQSSEKLHFLPPEHVQQPLIQTIVDELRGEGKCPSTGLSAARTSRVMDAIIGRL